MSPGFGPMRAGSKIKGGRWTVMRFFGVSIAFTIGWMTVSSQLGHYKLLFGPAILLQMNIAYFLPSLPLLVISSFLDDKLDKTFGVARTILVRLLFGLGGCAILSSAWPFVPDSRRALLVMVILLGMVSGIAFSAAYQLVAKFANKNTISLGLGCVGSGIVVLILETALQMKASPSHIQQIVLFELTAAIILFGGMAAFSLLIRHWNFIDVSGELGNQANTNQGNEVPFLEPTSPQVEENGEIKPRISKSLSRMIKYTPMDPFDTMSGAERLDDDEEEVLFAIRGLFRHSTFKTGQDWSTSSPRAVNILSFSDDSVSPQRLLPGSEDTSTNSGHTFTHSDSQPVGLIRVMALTWPIMGALFLSGLILCTIFPFFTFVPSSGKLGDTLPQVLFFVRLFGDITGRTIPRQKALAMRSQRWLFTMTVMLSCTVPFFFIYIKSSWQSDTLSIGYVVIVWMILGYVNSCAYMLAPSKVPINCKSTANGALAIMYQASHMLGLILALILTIILYGSFEV